jgi:TPR repeat protein
VFLAVGSVGVLAAGAAVARPQTIPQWRQEDLVSVEDLENACSENEAQADERCQIAVQIDLGRRPLIEEKRQPGEGFTQTSKLAAPEPEKAAWLMEQACAHGLWRTCMIYVLLLQRGGDGIAQDGSRADAILQAACAARHSPACDDLDQRQIPREANATLPPAPAWIRQPTPRPPSFRVVPREAPSAGPIPGMPIGGPTPTPTLDDPLDAGDEMEGEVFARCRDGSGSDCARLAMYYKQNGSTPERIAHYYEKACDRGYRPACATLGRSSAPGAASGAGAWTLAWIAGGAIVLLAVGAIVVVVRRSQGGAAPRPASSRPPSRRR